MVRRPKGLWPARPHRKQSELPLLHACREGSAPRLRMLHAKPLRQQSPYRQDRTRPLVGASAEQSCTSSKAQDEISKGTHSCGGQMVRRTRRSDTGNELETAKFRGAHASTFSSSQRISLATDSDPF